MSEFILKNRKTKYFSHLCMLRKKKLPSFLAQFPTPFSSDFGWENGWEIEWGKTVSWFYKKNCSFNRYWSNDAAKIKKLKQNRKIATIIKFKLEEKNNKSLTFDYINIYRLSSLNFPSLFLAKIDGKMCGKLSEERWY